ncbi:MAG: NTP transferase domain-containing protein [Bacteroidetes bacterium]|nr:NTP transferase domain-containing protein [Bacteroidota bacterium]
MKAIILAAGLGSRLKHVTHDKPKALVEVGGITMLESVILKLKSQGINELLINIHHFGQSIIDFLDTRNNFGVNITISDERDLLMDTGGAILKAKKFILGNEPVLVHNVDVISNVNIKELLALHTERKSMATLCVRRRDSQRGLLFNNNNLLIGWTNLGDKKYRWVNHSYTDYSLFAFSGIYLINPDFVDHITQTGVFSIIDTWLDIAKNHPISGYIDTSSIWHDLGTMDKICDAEKKLNSREKIS